MHLGNNEIIQSYLECFSLNIEKVFAVWKGAAQAEDVLAARGQMALETRKKKNR